MIKLGCDKDNAVPTCLKRHLQYVLPHICPFNEPADQVYRLVNLCENSRKSRAIGLLNPREVCVQYPVQSIRGYGHCKFGGAGGGGCRNAVKQSHVLSSMHSHQLVLGRRLPDSLLSDQEAAVSRPSKTLFDGEGGLV